MGEVIAPYFFGNEQGRALTVNDEHYREMITDFLWPELEGMDLDDMPFQQDGANCHKVDETLDLLRAEFPGRHIFQRPDMNWPTRSCDLKPSDLFSLGICEVYANNPQTVPELKNEIRRVIGETEPGLYGKVIENLTKRIHVCKLSRGGHLSDIVFHV